MLQYVFISTILLAILFFAAIHFAANCIAFIEANYFLLNDFALIHFATNCIAFIEAKYFLLNDFATIHLDANCIAFIEVNYFVLNDFIVNFSAQKSATICIATQNGFDLLPIQTSTNH